LREVLKSLAPVDEASLSRALADFSLRTLQEGEHLLRAGELAKELAFIERGLVREYYVSLDGDEHVRSFCLEGTFTGSLYDLLSGAPAVVNIEALEPTTLLVADWAGFQARCEREPLWHVAARRNAEALYCRKAIREHQMLALTAKERFLALLRDMPQLERRVAGRHLASYLGITPEHLSRIRRSH
jgi:CRP-like cAMP-binding protein